MKGIIIHECSTCKAAENEVCRYPQGGIRRIGMHDKRPFSLGVQATKAQRDKLKRMLKEMNIYYHPEEDCDGEEETG